MRFNFNIHNSKLAEIIGIMMGDGCLYFDKKSKKYQTSISFNKKEKGYLFYVKNLFEKYFKDYKFYITELESEFLLRNMSVYVGSCLVNHGLIAGNKVKNKIKIPYWIKDNNKFLLRFIRGLFDTDGCVYCKYGKYAQIQFKIANENLLYSLRKILINLNYNPTKVQIEKSQSRDFHPIWKLYIIKQNDINKFFNEIKPMNSKHNFRYKKIKSGAAEI